VKGKGKVIEEEVTDVSQIGTVGENGRIKVPRFRKVIDSDNVVDSGPDGKRATRGHGQVRRPIAGQMFYALADPMYASPSPQRAESLDQDTSDAFYQQLHKRAEMTEVRARLREREKLESERYHLRERLDMLRNMDPSVWANHITRTMQTRRVEEETTLRSKWVDTGSVGSLAKADSGYQPGKEKQWTYLDAGEELIKQIGSEGLRKRLIEEGMDLLHRWDEILPPKCVNSSCWHGFEAPQADLSTF
jgi:hypothetical protein